MGSDRFPCIGSFDLAMPRRDLRCRPLLLGDLVPLSRRQIDDGTRRGAVLLQFRQHRQAHGERQKIIDSTYRNGLATEEDMQQDHEELWGSTLDPGPSSTVEPVDPSDDLTLDFVRLSNLPTCPLDRLSRYEATLWRQACQILFTLQYLDRRKPWKGLRLRGTRDQFL